MDFNIVDEDHPDEVSVPVVEKPTPQVNNRPNPHSMQPPSRPLSRSHSAGNPPRPPQTPGQFGARSGPQNNTSQGQRPQHPLQQQSNQGRQQGPPGQNSNSSNNGPHQTPPQQAAVQAAAPTPENVGFFSARAVKQISGPKEDEEVKLPTAPQGALAFNPHAESPSIRKTPGIDHTKSKPLARNGQHVPPSQKADGDASTTVAGASAATIGGNAGRGGSVGTTTAVGAAIPAQRGNMTNPTLSQARRIGAPPGPSSPMANRGQYRPPTIKRPLPNEAAGGAPRPALAEVSVNGTTTVASAGGAGAVGGDPKRQKIG